MREILFRGKRTDNGKWVEGMLTAIGKKVAQIGTFSDYGTHICCNSSFAVVPETVGQFTGLLDKNGKKIFEGDVVRSDWGYHGIVEYDEIMYAKGECVISDDIEIIGNIYDIQESEEDS